MTTGRINQIATLGGELQSSLLQVALRVPGQRRTAQEQNGTGTGQTHTTPHAVSKRLGLGRAARSSQTTLHRPEFIRSLLS